MPVPLPSMPLKSWKIDYSPLSLDFTIVPSLDPSVSYSARSNVGNLSVNAIFPTGSLPVGESSAIATLDELVPASIDAPSSCSFGPLWFVGTNNNCSLNGGASGDTFLSWQTSGFRTTLLSQTPLAVTPSWLSTGPLKYYVDLTKQGLADSPFPTIVKQVEPYIHKTLVSGLPGIAWYSVVQDPGCVSLFATNPSGQSSGIDQSGSLNLAIPGSFYVASPTNPAILIVDPANGNYSVDVTGTCAGVYNLSMATVDVNSQTISQLTATGDIGLGDTIPYDFSLSGTGSGTGGTVTESFASVPEPDSLSLFFAALGVLAVVRVRRRVTAGSRDRCVHL